MSTLAGFIIGVAATGLVVFILNKRVSKTNTNSSGSGGNATEPDDDNNEKLEG